MQQHRAAVRKTYVGGEPQDTYPHRQQDHSVQGMPQFKRASESSRFGAHCRTVAASSESDVAKMAKVMVVGNYDDMAARLHRHWGIWPESYQTWLPIRTTAPTIGCECFMRKKSSA